MDNDASKTEYKAIDVAKLLFCICIVFLHSGAYHSVPGEWYVLHLLLRLAVPFFFVVSGFFWGRNVYHYKQEPAECLRFYEMRLLRPYIVFSAANILFAVIEMLLDGENIFKIILRVGRAVVFYPYGALWYVWACMIAVFLLYFFVIKDKLNYAIILGGVLYCIALLINSYYFLIEDTWFQKIVDLYLKITTSARNGLFVGFLFIGIGVFLAKYESIISKKNSLVVAVVVFILSYGLLALEVFVIKGKTTADDHSLFFSFIFLIPSLVIILLHCKIRKMKKETAVICRNLSTGVYYLHKGVIACVYIFAALMGSTLNEMVLFCGVLISCLLVCIGAYKSGESRISDLLK